MESDMARILKRDPMPLLHFCLEPTANLEDLAQLAVFGLCGAMMLTVFLGNVMHVCKFHWLPESLVAVILGAVIGFIAWESPYDGGSETLDFGVEYMYFALYLKLFALPLIIFEAGWSLRLRDFFSQLTYILIFAIIGTVVSIMVVASLMMAAADRTGIHCWQTAMAYASLISSVDPVATLATFGSLNVDRLLFILVFGESQINDAVAITMFDAFNNAYGDHSPIKLVLQTLWYLLGSILLGNGLGMVYILIMRGGRMKRSPSESILFLALSSTFTYQLAEFIGMSGIITVLFCGIMVSAYVGPHLSNDGIVLFSFFLKQMASLCDMLIFVFVGISAVQVNKEDLVLAAWIMLFVLVSRAVAIFPLGLLCNAIKACVSRHLPAEKQHYVSWKHMVMMWHGGVCRGGVSLWMATEMEAWVDDENPGTRRRLINATFILICTFLLVFGGTTACCMRWLQLPMGDQVDKSSTLYSSDDKSGFGWRLRSWTRKKVLIPLLVGSHHWQQSRRKSKSCMDSVLEDDRARRNAQRGAEVWELFGMDDPGLRDQIEDILHDEEDESEEEESEGDEDAGDTVAGPSPSDVSAEED